KNEDWMILFDGFIVVNFHQSDAFRGAVAATPFGKFIQGTEYGSYAVDNQFADNHDVMVAAKTPEAEYFYTLETVHGGVMSIWHDPVEYYWYAQRKRPKAEDIYTLNPNNVSPSKTLVLH